MHSGKSVYEGETFYGWDAAKGVLRFWYFNSLGGVSTGTAKQQGEAWIFEQVYEGGPKPQRMRTTMERPDAESYVFATETLVDGTWKDAHRTRFTRIKR